MLIKHAWLKVKTIRNWQFPWEMSKSKGDVSESAWFFLNYIYIKEKLRNTKKVGKNKSQPYHPPPPVISTSCL